MGPSFPELFPSLITWAPSFRELFCDITQTPFFPVTVLLHWLVFKLLLDLYRLHVCVCVWIGCAYMAVYIICCICSQMASTQPPCMNKLGTMTTVWIVCRTLQGTVCVSVCVRGREARWGNTTTSSSIDIFLKPKSIMQFIFSCAKRTSISRTWQGDALVVW